LHLGIAHVKNIHITKYNHKGLLDTGSALKEIVSGMGSSCASTTKYTKAAWFKSGVRILLLGGLALPIGFIVGQLVKMS